MRILETWNSTIKEHISTIKTFLVERKKLHKYYIERTKNRSDIGFNVFTLSSDFYYRENFHSDIIKSFLDPEGKHNEGSKYLFNFIDLLYKKNNEKLVSKEDFKSSIVEREKHNIDILITDEISKKAIIIENKINNAVDQQRQLPRYFEIIKKEFRIVAVVYLTLNSSKRPDKIGWNKKELEEIESILKIIPAFDIDASKTNLYNDWIIPSIISSNNIDSAFLLRQYGNLIKYLNTNTMDTISLEYFYNSLKENENENENLKTAISIRNMLNDLPEYLAIRIEEKYKEHYYPFKKIWRYKLIDTVFDGFETNDINLKIDVWSSEKGYSVHFWESKCKVDYDIMSEFENKIDLSGFNMHDGKKSEIKKHFKIFEENKLYEFIDELLIKLIEMKEKNNE